MSTSSSGRVQFSVENEPAHGRQGHDSFVPRNSGVRPPDRNGSRTGSGQALENRREHRIAQPEMNRILKVTQSDEHVPGLHRPVSRELQSSTLGQAQSVAAPREFQEMPQQGWSHRGQQLGSVNQTKQLHG